MQADSNTSVSNNSTSQSCKTDCWQPKGTLAGYFGEDFVTFLLVITFILIITSQMFISWKKKWESNAIKLIIITTISFFGVFLALTVDNDKNSSAAFALLGTLAGYILGRSEEKPNTTEEKTTSTDTK